MSNFSNDILTRVFVFIFGIFLFLYILVDISKHSFNTKYTQLLYLFSNYKPYNSVESANSGDTLVKIEDTLWFIKPFYFNIIEHIPIFIDGID